MGRFTDKGSAAKTQRPGWEPKDAGHRAHGSYEATPSGPVPNGSVVDPGARSGKANDKSRTVPHSWGMTEQQKATAGVGGLSQAAQLEGGGHVLSDSSQAAPAMQDAYGDRSRPLGRNKPLVQNKDTRSRHMDDDAGGDAGANIKRAPTLDLNKMANAVHDQALEGSLFHDRQAHALPGTTSGD